nr:hypothetical protein CFP56_78711 [Quercus suber]
MSEGECGRSRDVGLSDYLIGSTRHDVDESCDQAEMFREITLRHHSSPCEKVGRFASRTATPVIPIRAYGLLEEDFGSTCAPEQLSCKFASEGLAARGTCASVNDLE